MGGLYLPPGSNQPHIPAGEGVTTPLPSGDFPAQDYRPPPLLLGVCHICAAVLPDPSVSPLQVIRSNDEHL